MSSFIAVEDVLDDGQVYGQSSRDLHIHFNHSLTWQVNGRCYCELTLAKQACEDGNNWLRWIFQFRIEDSWGRHNYVAGRPCQRISLYIKSNNLETYNQTHPKRYQYYFIVHLSLVQDNMAIESRKFFVMRTGSSKTQTGLAMDGTGVRKLGKPNVSSAIAAIMP